MTARRQAHRLQDMKFSVVPLEPMGKRPILKNWQETRSDHDLIEQWWRRCPNANLGIHTGYSEIAVADCDSEEAAEWVSLNLPQSPMFQHSPRGGLHVFYRDAAQLRPRVNLMNLKLDIRAGLSQIVCFPSRCEKGQWRLEGLTEPSKLPVMPSDFLADAERVRERVKTVIEIPADMTRVYRYVDKCPPAISGQNGHGVTFRVACCLLRAFPWLSLDQLLMALRHFNLRCEPPWTEKELAHKAADALAKVKP